MPPRKRVQQKPIIYCIDGTTLVRDVWLEEPPRQEAETKAGTEDFLKWLLDVHAAPTATSKHFKVVFDGPERPFKFPAKKAAKAKAKAKGKLKGLELVFSEDGSKQTLLIEHVRALRMKEERVVLVSADGDLIRQARAEHVRCITPQDFLMAFQAVL